MKGKASARGKGVAESPTAEGLGGLLSMRREGRGPGLVAAGGLVTVETFGFTHPD